MHRNVPRNDVNDALAYIREAVERDGFLAEEDAEQLLMLQDDPEDYAGRAEELLRGLGASEPMHDPGPMLHWTPPRR